MTNGSRTYFLRTVLTGSCLAAVLSSCANVPQVASSDALTQPPASARCTDPAWLAQDGAPVEGLVITSGVWVEDGTLLPNREGPPAALPAHCLVEGYFAEREGSIGGPYRIGFRMRLPEQWNGRFFFQGGGGSNGVVRDATGFNGPGNPSALVRGYAVIAQDSGHDNSRNTLPDHQGELVFGFDPQARRDYGHASLKPVYDLGQHLVRTFYGEGSETNIFWGCSKGGQEGMAFAQRYPEAFDGIVAMAPGMSLPRAALAETWDTQAFARILQQRGEHPSVDRFRTLFSTAQYTLVAEAALAACDGIDGTADGIIAAIGQCTTARVEPQLRARQCAAGQGSSCLEPAQIDALISVMDGPHNSAGEQLYAPWAWDGGMGAEGWAGWKTGSVGGSPARNIVLGGSSLAAVFTSPPTALPADPEHWLQWQLGFDFDHDAPKIYAVEAPFTTSAWQDVGMRSTDLTAFEARGGKLIVPHGSSDPVFSVLDTIDWWNGVNAQSSGAAADFVRVFPVPGMNHCGGGPATDRFDSLAALERWVTEGQAPASIPARASAGTPWPGREMPLCPYPQIARMDVSGRYRCGES